MNGQSNLQNVLHLFERQVERDPNAIAVTSGHGELTYRELNDRAEDLADHLRARRPTALAVELSVIRRCGKGSRRQHGHYRGDDELLEPHARETPGPGADS